VRTLEQIALELGVALPGRAQGDVHVGEVSAKEVRALARAHVELRRETERWRAYAWSWCIEARHQLELSWQAAAEAGELERRLIQSRLVDEAFDVRQWRRQAELHAEEVAKLRRELAELRAVDGGAA